MGCGSKGGPPPTPSPRMRVLVMAVAMLHILLSSGEAYGWTALRPVLLREGYFDAASASGRTRRLTLVSTLGISANAMVKLPLGFILDSAGPRVTALLGSVFFMLGCGLMAWGDRQSVAQMGLGYFLLGTSGPFLQMPAFQFSNLFPARKASLISLMITAFELSTGVFYLFNVANVKLELSATTLFGAYGTVGLFTFVTALTMWPDSPHVEPGAPPPAADDEEDKGELEDGVDQRPAVVGGSVPLIERGFWGQVFSWEFTYVTFFFAVHNFTQGVVLATTGMQVSHYFPDERTAEMLADAFSVILPMGFLPVLLCTLSGISGFILTRPQLAFMVVSLMSCTYGAMFLVPTIPCYLFLFAIFPVARQFVFSTFISYSADKFGFRTFGTINGLASTIAGLVQLLQTYLVQICVDPNGAFGWEELDTAMATVPLLLVIPPVWSWLSAACAAPPQPPALTEEQQSLAEVTESLLVSAPMRMPTRSHDITSAASSLASRDIPHLGSLTVTVPTLGSFSSRSHPYLAAGSPQRGHR